MQVLLEVIKTLNNKSSVADSAFAAIGSLASALSADFEKYMQAFAPFLFRALGNREEPSLCAMAIGLVSDITRALEARAQPYCNEFMNLLLENLRVSRTTKISMAWCADHSKEQHSGQPVQARDIAMLRRHCASHRWRL